MIYGDSRLSKSPRHAGVPVYSLRRASCALSEICTTTLSADRVVRRDEAFSSRVALTRGPWLIFVKRRSDTESLGTYAAFSFLERVVRVSKRGEGDRWRSNSGWSRTTGRFLARRKAVCKHQLQSGYGSGRLLTDNSLCFAAIAPSIRSETTGLRLMSIWRPNQRLLCTLLARFQLV